MPRRTRSDARTTAQKAREARWRFLLRNPEFRADLNAIRKHYRAGHGHDSKVEKIVVKWRRAVEVPTDLTFYLETPEARPDTIPVLEAALDREERGSPVGDAVTSHDPYDADDVPPGLFPGQSLTITVDLSQPDDVLLALIGDELRRAREQHPRPRGRRRLDRLDFHLRVYDLAAEGQTFSAIARTLTRRLSTVKSAFLAAHWAIFGPAGGPSKRELPLVDFDVQGHCQKCPTCRKAERSAQLCRKARIYANVGE